MRRGQAGLTLLEVMIAMSILAIGIMALVAALGSIGASTELNKDYNLAYRAATSALDHLKAYAYYDTLYRDFSPFQKDFQPSVPAGPFAVLETGEIDWNQHIDPNNPPATVRGLRVVGYGWFEFVVNELGYRSTEWGPDTTWATGANGNIVPDIDGDGVSDGIDLDADGFASDSAITVGRTVATPETATGYYVILPVKVTVVMFGRQGAQVELRSWIVNGKWK